MAKTKQPLADGECKNVEYFGEANRGTSKFSKTFLTKSRRGRMSGVELARQVGGLIQSLCKED